MPILIYPSGLQLCVIDVAVAVLVKWNQTLCFNLLSFSDTKHLSAYKDEPI
jgi:hypothetical protein